MLSMPRPLTFRHARVPAVLFVLLAALAVLAGCGGKKNDEGVLLATVGANEIRSGYYEDRLKRLEESELPRGEDGSLLDMAGREGKTAFLTTLINKELMAQKATQLGYADEPRIADARQAMAAYEAGLVMWAQVIGEPANELSNEEVDALYARLGDQRRIQYLICNFEDDAKAAREMALSGADWEDVVSRYHSGIIPQSGRLDMTIPFGRFDPEFEAPIFAAEIGGLTEPIPTEYGWWVVRVEGEKAVQKPPREEALANILDLTRKRKIMKLQEQFREEVQRKHNLEINEDTLFKCWQGLPEKEDILDPATNEPVPQAELLPLEVATADLDLPFYSYDLDGEHHAFTLGDYKIRFDRMNTFQRPKKSNMMGGLRAHVTNELERSLMAAEARSRGLLEHPEVKAKVAIKVEEMMITALYGELVTIDDRVTMEQLEEFWRDHHAEYDQPERRSGHLVIAADEARARDARARLAAGTSWLEIVKKYGTDENNKRNAGKLDNVPETTEGPVRDALFVQELGTLGQPFPVGDGRWALVQVDDIKPGGPVELLEVSEAVGQRIKAARKEAAFAKLLADWATEFGVQRYDENLDQVKSWKELTDVEAPGPAVPRGV